MKGFVCVQDGKQRPLGELGGELHGHALCVRCMEHWERFQELVEEELGERSAVLLGQFRVLAARSFSEGHRVEVYAYPGSQRGTGTIVLVPKDGGTNTDDFGNLAFGSSARAKQALSLAILAMMHGPSAWRGGDLLAHELRRLPKPPGLPWPEDGHA